MRTLEFFAKFLISCCGLVALAIGILWCMTCHERTIATGNYGKGHAAAFSTLGDLVERRPLWRPYYEVVAVNNGPYMFVGYHVKENILVYGQEPASGYSCSGIVTQKQLNDIISRLPKDPKAEDIHKIISAYPRPKQYP